MKRRAFFRLIGAAVAAPAIAILGWKALDKPEPYPKGIFDCDLSKYPRFQSKIGRGWKVKHTFRTSIGDQPFTMDDNGRAVLLAKDGSGEIRIPRLSEMFPELADTNC